MDRVDDTVAMFRRPAQRLLSAFRDRKHADGFQDRDKAPNWRELSVGLRAASASQGARRGCSGRQVRARPPEEQETARRRTRPRGRPARREGDGRGPAPRLRGLQEAADSICLFHAMLGGAPRKIEFVVAHSRRRRGRDASPTIPYDEGRLDGFVDAADEAVYAEAARVFEANLRRFAPGCVT